MVGTSKKLVHVINWTLKNRRIPRGLRILSKRHYGKEIAPLPIFAQIEPTNRCNLRCISCGRETLNKNRIGDMSLQNYKKILSAIPTLMIVKLQGYGEPFLNKEMVDFLVESKRRGIFTNVTTNGTIIPADRLDELMQSVDEICFSIDGATAETFQKIRRGSDLAKIISNIKMIVEARHKVSSKTILDFNVVCSDLNSHELPAILRLGEQLGIDGIHLSFIQNWIPHENADKRTLVEGLKLKGDSREKMFEMIRPGDYRVAIHGMEPATGAPKKIFCDWPWDKVFITWDGYITTCCIRMDPDVMNFGNVFTQEFKLIWNGEKYRAYRRGFLSGTVPGVCNGCEVIQ